MKNILDQIKKLPYAPGVYFFKGIAGETLYIGKATSLRSRVRSYFRDDLETTRGPKLVVMLSLATRVDFRETDSVLEALLLETELIRKYQPKYNTDLKDDKSHNLVVITKEDFPRVLLIRQREITEGKFDAKQIKYSFGPFPHGMELTEAMRIIRRIFPYRDKCIPGQGKSCFNAQIGLCPGVCTGAISKKEYAKTIQNIKLFFEGKKKTLVKKLERDMKEYAKGEEFEKAGEMKRTLFAIGHIQDVSLIKHEYAEKHEKIFRIEAYDVAHISGTNVVGVMTVVENGAAKKSDYRKFKIKSFKGADDTRALREILSRRLTHPEWPMPKLMVVDGGKAQLNAAEKVLAESGMVIPVVGVVKDERHRPREIIGDETLRREHEKEILLANAEAHRFAVAYHRKKRERLSA